jgi:hypothetical protein
MTTKTTKTAVAEAKATTSLQWRRLSDGGDGGGGDSGESDSDGGDGGGGES